MNWIKTTDRLPERDNSTTNSRAPYLAWKRYDWARGGNTGHYYQTQILQFNHEHQCWDTEDGDDYDCDIERVEYWMPLPEPPK